MELNTTKEKVLELANTSNDAKEVLKELFPQAFECKSVDLFSNLLFDNAEQVIYYKDESCPLIEMREGGENGRKAFWLNSESFNWKLKIDSYGVLCLIPSKK